VRGRRVPRAASVREAGADPATLGALATGMFHTLSLRARAGETRKRLDQLADAAVALLCGATPATRSRSVR
ncbi:MAG: hypothetical protein WKG01_41650, partial [Kofleriaceae bacterium]